MPQYILELTWTDKGRNNSVPVTTRRGKAMAVADANNVTGWSGQPISGSDIIDTDTGALWKVQGNDSDIRAMISTWESHGNVTVADGPQ